MKKGFGKKRVVKSQDMPLQITSMADIFMILLVFLLKSFSTSVANIAPTGDTRLPVGTSTGTIKDSLKVEISKNAILLDEKSIVTLKDFEFFPGESPSQGVTGPLFRALSDQRKKLPEPNRESHLVVMADERTPYSTIKGVLASAANAGFVDLQLVVVQEE